jgi:hypothetical protein
MHIRLGGACNERLVVFKVVVKEGYGGCLRIGLAIFGKRRKVSILFSFLFFLKIGGLLGILFNKGFGCSLFWGV